MENSEILKKIETIQYAIDMYIAKNTATFKSNEDLKTLEAIYNEITGRNYTKFDASCGSCVKEALIICNNFRKRELKKMEAEEAKEEPTIEPIAEVIPAEVKIEEPKPIKPKAKNVRKRK